MNLCAVGMKTIGAGFLVARAEAEALGLGQNDRISPYLNGRDLMSRARGVYVLDMFGLTEAEVRDQHPKIYQHLRNTVYDIRQQNNNKLFREFWWILGHPRPIFRDFTRGLTRYIATLETAKHQVFQFLDVSIVPDSTIVTFGADDAYVLGVLSSRVHVVWALAQGSRLGVGNDPRYNKTRCFETFPFPVASPEQQQRIRELAERLDAHRKARLAEHPKLTMTDMYNALEALRSGQALDGKLKAAHDQGLVTTLKQLHDELDAAVLEAYGWSANLTEQDILANLAALNAVRVQEEQSGLVRYLRPEYQDPQGRVQHDLGLAVSSGPLKVAQAVTFPATLPLQVQAVRSTLQQAGKAMSSRELTQHFSGAKEAQLEDIMQTLVLLGQAQVREQDGEVKYAA